MIPDRHFANDLIFVCLCNVCTFLVVLLHAWDEMPLKVMMPLPHPSANASRSVASALVPAQPCSTTLCRQVAS